MLLLILFRIRYHCFNWAFNTVNEKIINTNTMWNMNFLLFVSQSCTLSLRNSRAELKVSKMINLCELSDSF